MLCVQGQKTLRGRDEGGWRRHVACRREGPELFFPVGSVGPALAQIAEAKAVCTPVPGAEGLPALRAEHRAGLRIGTGSPKTSGGICAAANGCRGRPHDQRLAG